MSRQAGAGPAAQRQRDRFQHCRHRRGPARVPAGQPCHLLGESRLVALLRQAAEPAHFQADEHLAAADSRIQQRLS
jgi:hypothetical protein